MSHYFQNDDKLESHRRNISYVIANHVFEVWSDAGVFSKNELDYGSKLLIENGLKIDLGSDILDLGCGLGPIGLTLAFFRPHSFIDCLDINQRAVELCRANIARLNLKNIQAEVSDGIKKDKLYDTILLNPPIRAGKKVIYDLFLQSYQHLKENGQLLIVMRKDQGALSGQKAIQQIFANCRMIDRSKGFMIFVAKKVCI